MKILNSIPGFSTAWKPHSIQYLTIADKLSYRLSNESRQLGIKLQKSSHQAPNKSQTAKHHF